MQLPIPDQRETGRILQTLIEQAKQDPAKAVLRGDAARRFLRGVIQAGGLKAGLSPLEALRQAGDASLAEVPIEIQLTCVGKNG